MSSDVTEGRPRPADEVLLLSQVHLARSIWARRAYFVGGALSFVLGMIGLLLPVVPTTPFLLLAAYCFAKSSERFYLWLLTNRFFGEYIRDWREHRGIPLRTKIFAILLLWVAIVGSMFIVPLLVVRIATGVAAFGVSVYILRQPTKSANRVPVESKPGPEVT